MSTRELVIDKIQKMPEPYLPELYEIIQEFEAAKQDTSAKPNLMAKLRSIKISAPRDFSQKVDLYVAGNTDHV
ncbi:MAG: hypothetical protein ACREOO_28095 [bacterium]